MTLLVVLAISPNIFSASGTDQHNPNLVPEHAQSGLDSALRWLASHQATDGSYGPYFEGQAAAAAYALWLNDSTSRYSTLAYDYLVRELNDSSTWFWGTYGEADVPGEVLFSIAITHHLELVKSSEVESWLLYFQQPNGGFNGYYDGTRTVTSSVDTAMALWGLYNAGLIPRTNRTAAVNYLLTLQNHDGGFNLTSIKTADPIYSLGPDQTAITALTILALRDNGFNVESQPISNALDYLGRAVSTGFGGPNQAYDAALSSLAFLQCYHPHEAIVALTYLADQQKSDGGFSDASRSSGNSNALDTGWASIALQYVNREYVNVRGPVNQPPVARYSFSPSNPANGTTVSFDAGSSSDSDGDNLSYDWTFGDGGSDSGQRVTHSYAESGTYTVTLIVTDSGINPSRLTGTTWHSLTVQLSQTRARAATAPSTLTTNLGLVLGALAVAVAASYMVFMTSKRRRLKK